MAKKTEKKLWEEKKTPEGKFTARLREAAEAKGIYCVDDLVRLSPRFKIAAATRWWFATRLPTPPNIVDLAKHLDRDPLEFIKGLGLDMRTIAGVEAVVKAER